jgi:hypothetical protein
MLGDNEWSKLTAEPAAVPGLRAAKTMYAGLYGELAPRPLPDPPADATMDAYSLFESRSAAMGWLTPATEGASGGLWGMNDAAAVFGSGLQSSRVAFFQVVLTGPSPVTVLPVQQFLSCAGDVIARLGVLRLKAVQLLLPERDAEADARFASQSGLRAAAVLLNIGTPSGADGRFTAELVL